jgi:hypothetical protein
VHRSHSDDGFAIDGAITTGGAAGRVLPGVLTVHIAIRWKFAIGIRHRWGFAIGLWHRWGFSIGVWRTGSFVWQTRSKLGCTGFFIFTGPPDRIGTPSSFPLRLPGDVRVLCVVTPAAGHTTGGVTPGEQAVVVLLGKQVAKGTCEVNDKSSIILPSLCNPQAGQPATGCQH